MPPTPSDPGGPPGYVLDWEREVDRMLPTKAPAGWVGHYDPAQRHDGEPQARAASGPTEPVRFGGHSVRFELHRGDKRVRCGVRSELAFTPPEPPRTDPSQPTERWYGFSIFLPHTWLPDPAPEVLTQWHQDDNSPGGSPPLAIMTRKPPNRPESHWFISQRRWESNDTVNTDVGACDLGQWTDWVVHVRWSARDNGLLTIWRNGSLTPGFNRKIGRNTFTDETRHYMKFGIYKWLWNKSAMGDIPAGQTCSILEDTSTINSRLMYHDEVRIVAGAPNSDRYTVVAPPGDRPPPVPLP